MNRETSGARAHVSWVFSNESKFKTSNLVFEGSKSLWVKICKNYMIPTNCLPKNFVLALSVPSR